MKQTFQLQASLTFNVNSWNKTRLCIQLRHQNGHECCKTTKWYVALRACLYLNTLECRCNYSATSNNAKLVHWLLTGGLLHLVQRGGDWAGPLLAVPNVTAHPSMASVPITVLLYDGPLLCTCAHNGLNSTSLLQWFVDGSIELLR